MSTINLDAIHLETVALLALPLRELQDVQTGMQHFLNFSETTGATIVLASCFKHLVCCLLVVC